MGSFHRAFASFIILFLLTSGALGLKHPSECTHLTRAGGGMECLHTAAVSRAYLGDEDGARNSCLDIYMRYGVPAGYADDDASRRAELETNNCLYDIARILGDPSLCDQITESESSLSTGLFGAPTNAHMCKEAAGKAANLKAENYWGSELYQNSICAMLFLLPPLVIGAIRFGR